LLAEVGLTKILWRLPAADDRVTWRAWSQDRICDEMQFANGANEQPNECIASDKLATITKLRPVAGWPVTHELYWAHSSTSLMSWAVTNETARQRNRRATTRSSIRRSRPLGNDGKWLLQSLGCLVWHPRRSGGELGSKYPQTALMDDWKTVSVMGSPLLGREDT
jgi:hypothetical protein